MPRMRKITIEVPWDLSKGAQHVSGTTICETVGGGLRLLVTHGANEYLLRVWGKVRFSIPIAMLKADR